MACMTDTDEMSRDSQKINEIFNQLSATGKIQLLTYSTAIRDAELIARHEQADQKTELVQK